jgi:hypothetical protein
MMILVHASPTTLAPYRSENLGVLCSPRRVYGDEMRGWSWAADNDAFSHWDEGRYRDMLMRLEGRKGCLFVTAPDVVGDATETLRRFALWRSALAAFPVALVAQDGLGIPPWEEFDALFIGGTTEWKMGEQAARLVREAKHRGKWVHMGRVNSYKRGRYARWLGCDSIDGSQFSWFRDTKLPSYLNSLRQEMLVQAAADASGEDASPRGERGD